jgi:Protein of unknown function (DUF2752)
VRTTDLDVRDLRIAGAVMLGAAAVLPAMPGSPGIACPLRALTGVPCPLCGMTTSVEHVVRLEFGAALAANPAGLAAVLVAVLLLVLRPRQVRVPSLVLPLGLAAMWVFELYRFGLF